MINRDKNIKLSPSIENYMLNCKSEKCRLQSLHLNNIHRKSFGEFITFMDNEEFDKVENYINSNECHDNGINMKNITIVYYIFISEEYLNIFIKIC